MRSDGSILPTTENHRAPEITLNSPQQKDARGLAGSLKAAARKWPDRAAIRFAGRETSFAQLDGLSDRVAANLAALGMQRADRIALYCPNSDVFAVAYLGIIKAGATVVPINLLLNPNEISYILEDSGCRGLIYHDAFVDSVKAFSPGLDRLECIVCIGQHTADEKDHGWARLLDEAADCPELAVDADVDVASILYTSGTTGRPKGAMLTHRNLLSNTASLRQVLNVVPDDDVFLVVLPMFHAFAATVGMLLPIVHGCTFAPVPKFEPRLVVDTIADTAATIFLGVPSMYKVLMGLPDDAVQRFSSVRL